jgi:hypothetical protein
LSGRELGEAQPVAVQLVMTDRSLTGIGDPVRAVDEPARLVGHGPVPAAAARRWLSEHEDAAEAVKAWVRRVFTAPSTRDLVAMESRSELFPAALRSVLVLRDDTCRTPFCDAPIAHADHVVSRARGGRSTAANGQGLCARCNLTKEAPGWGVEVVDPRSPSDTTHETVTTTPTGHRYRSTAPPVLGLGWSPPQRGANDDDWDDVDWREIERDHPDWYAGVIHAA